MFSLSQLLERSARVNGGGTATVFASRRRSWTELRHRVRGLAGGLRSLGLRPGDRVAILAHNSDRYYECLFGVPWAGGVLQPINTRLAPPEMVHWLTDSGARVLLLDRHFADAWSSIRESLPGIESVVWLEDEETPAGMRDYEDLLASAPAEDAGRKDEDLATLMYTGGTTGRSKGVMLSHRAIVANVLQCLPHLTLDRHTRCLHAAPMFHAADGFFCVCAAAVGATNVIVPGFEPVSTMAAIASERVDAALLVPTMINMLASHPAVPEHDLSSLRTVVYGASPMPEDVLRRAMGVLPGVDFIQAYGQTEAGPVLTILDASDHRLDGTDTGRLRSAGRAIPCVDLEIRDERDRPLPAGEVGEICARGPNIMSGYHGLPEVSAETLRGGWLHTGDGAYMDADGYVYIVDRLKDVIVSGAENVYSAETENALHTHPAVAECAVIGIPHDRWGEQVHAIVRLKPGAAATEEALIRHCHGLIAGYECPRSIEFRETPLPLSGAGKILKRELRAPYWEGQERGVH
jgi:long-chain acyl-CoA synthetase